jgi:hypothetical protein
MPIYRVEFQAFFAARIQISQSLMATQRLPATGNS